MLFDRQSPQMRNSLTFMAFSASDSFFLKHRSIMVRRNRQTETDSMDKDTQICGGCMKAVQLAWKWIKSTTS